LSPKFLLTSNAAVKIEQHCTTEFYTKPNGARACGILLDGKYNNYQGVTECAKLGARLSEAVNYQDFLMLTNLTVSNQSVFNSNIYIL